MHTTLFRSSSFAELHAFLKKGTSPAAAMHSLKQRRLPRLHEKKGDCGGVAAAGRGGPDSLREEDAMAAVELLFWERGSIYSVVGG